MKAFMWFIIETCVAIVLVVIFTALVYGVSEYFNSMFRGVLAMIGAAWFVGKLKDK